MKLKKSKLLTVVLSVPLGAVLLVNSAFAASSTSTTVGGVSVSGSISKYNYGATGTTYCTSTSCTSTVKVTYNYRFGPANQVKSATASATNIVQANASANAGEVPAVFVSAKGEHSISYYSSSGQYYSWSGSTDL